MEEKEGGGSRWGEGGESWGREAEDNCHHVWLIIVLGWNSHHFRWQCRTVQNSGSAYDLVLKTLKDTRIFTPLSTCGVWTI